MRRKWNSYNYIILLIFCPVLLCCVSVRMVSGASNDLIKKNCETIQRNLKNLQRNDARTRVHLGAYYEVILSKYITPLNVRLVENNLSDGKFVENQNKIAEARTVFSNDFINYQQNLEELTKINCETEPDAFSDKLSIVKKKRQIMKQDTLKIRELFSEHLRLVDELKGKL